MSETSTKNVTTQRQPRLRAALAQVRGQMAILEPHDLLPITVDPLAAVSTARGALPQLLKLRDQMVALPGFESKNIDDLETLAVAAQATQSILLAADSPPERFNELMADATELRQRLYNDALALAQRGLISEAPLQALKGPVGFRNVASDLGILAMVFRAAGTRIEGKTCVTEEELDQAEIYSEDVIADLGLKNNAPATVAGVALERQQAFTLFINAYDQVRRAVTYLRWNQDDIDDFAPSLYSGRKRKASSEVAAQTPATSPTAPTAATQPATQPATAATTPASPSAQAPAIGLPGADPFVR